MDGSRIRLGRERRSLAYMSYVSSSPPLVGPSHAWLVKTLYFPWFEGVGESLAQSPEVAFVEASGELVNILTGTLPTQLRQRQCEAIVETG